MQICFVDDRKKNQVAWNMAMSRIAGHRAQLRGFLSIDGFQSAISNGYEPRVVFIDFFIGPGLGLQIIRCCRKKFGRNVCLIAHGSMTLTNWLMVRLGAAFAIRKVTGRIPSQAIHDTFDNWQEFLSMIPPTTI